MDGVDRPGVRIGAIPADAGGLYLQRTVKNAVLTPMASADEAVAQLKAGGLTLPLAAGMQLSAEIVQGKRTVLEYVLSPVQRIKSEAGMER